MKQCILISMVVFYYSCHSYIVPVNTDRLSVIPKCSEFKQKIQQHIYLNTKDTIVLINLLPFKLSDYNDCVKSFNKEQIRYLFGQPIYADSVAFCYKIMKDDEQHVGYEAGKKVYYGGYFTMIIWFKGDFVESWEFGAYKGLNPGSIHGHPIID